jgi:hypothetical protein
MLGVAGVSIGCGIKLFNCAKFIFCGNKARNVIIIVFIFVCRWYGYQSGRRYEYGNAGSE